MSHQLRPLLAAFILLLLIFPTIGFAQIAYVANSEDNTVSVVDTAANPPAVTATVNVGKSPRFIAVSPDGTKVYVCNADDQTISLIDTTMPLTNPPSNISAGGDNYIGMVLTPDGTKLFIPHSNNTISVFDAQRFTLITTFRLSNTSSYYVGPPQGIVISPDSSTVYIAQADIEDGDVWTVNTNNYTSTGPSPIGGGDISISPDGSKLYSYNYNLYPPVVEIDSVTGYSSVGYYKTIGYLLPGEYGSLTFVPNGTKAYIFGGAGVELINTTTGAVISSLKVGAVSGSSNSNIAISSDGSKVCVPNSDDNTISLIDSSATPPVVTNLAIKVGKYPTGVAFSPVEKVTIVTPFSGASPRSSYVALTGRGPTNATVEILVDGVANLHSFRNTTAKVDRGGEWEKVIYVGQGNHLLKAEDMADSTDVSNTVIVEATPPQTVPLTTTDYTLLQKADIFLVDGFHSPQREYFGIPTTGFQYTHTALYLGGNPDGSGTPMIAEAVTAAEGGSYGSVRDVPLEISTVWTDGLTIDIYRPITALSKTQKAAIVAWAQGVTNKGLPYWGYNDWKYFGLTWLQWNVVFDTPTSPVIFQMYLTALDQKKFAIDRFICSTLVWHSYYAGTDGNLDLSLPNNATPQAVIGHLIKTKFLHAVQPHFVFPDTLAANGKLAKIN